MIPIRDTVQSRSRPVVNSTIIGINVLVYLFQITQGENLGRFFVTYGLVPARYSTTEIAAYFTSAQQAFSFLSYMFIHGGFWHLVGNMWSLFIFGDNVEDRLGPLRYLLFYLLCGFLSGLFHILINWHSKAPTIGASGAIAGIMGAYILLYPRSKILTLIPIFFIPYFLELPAFIFLGIWFLFQFISAAGGPAGGGGIAWWAHISGFVMGILLLKLFLWIPEGRVTRYARDRTAKKKTRRFQVIRTAGTADDLHLYGTLDLTSQEALSGTRKLVNIPWGFQKRLFALNVPPGVRHGSSLRLAGMGREDNGSTGNLYLKVLIKDSD